MPHTTLDEQHANAICTAIILGYASSNDRTFQYEKEEDRESHIEIREKFKSLGITINISQSGNRAKYPIIIAKTQRFTDEQLEGKNGLNNAGITLNSLESGINATDTYGAYIGGYEDISKTILIGPSALEQYQPQFRLADDATIKISYNKAKKATNAAIRALKDANTLILKRKNIKLNLIDEIKEDFQKSKVFKSYHGMIQAMIKYANTTDKNSLIYEIAYGPNTNKVSSCFPCCTFMTANNTPPTSTHLGRGDNWNIPKNCESTMRKNWEENIKKWYQKGQEVLAVKGINIPTEMNDQIPELFLEALTFESSFINKIKNTLGHY